jgi:hypothetical protein
MAARCSADSSGLVEATDGPESTDIENQGGDDEGGRTRRNTACRRSPSARGSRTDPEKFPGVRGTVKTPSVATAQRPAV